MPQDTKDIRIAFRLLAQSKQIATIMLQVSPGTLCPLALARVRPDSLEHTATPAQQAMKTIQYVLPFSAQMLQIAIRTLSPSAETSSLVATVYAQQDSVDPRATHVPTAMKTIRHVLKYRARMPTIAMGTHPVSPALS